MVALDTETNGRDFLHGSRPFFVSTCTPDGAQRYWEWSVDPFTREVTVPDGDLQEIADYLFADGPFGPIGHVGREPEDCGDFEGGLVLQNAKFDFQALRSVGFWDGPYADVDQVWDSVHDTLTAGHVLASNRPHNLTDAVMDYLGVDILPYEVALKTAVKEARQLCRTKDFRGRHGEWALAEEGRPDMPSAKGDLWGLDYWLPKAVADAEDYPADHLWRTVLRDYANTDTAVTVALWREMRHDLEKRGLWRIYLEARRLGRVLDGMEAVGMTGSYERTQTLVTEFGHVAGLAEVECVAIAKNLGYDLDLPRGASPNDSLRTFCFDYLKLPPVYDKKSKTGAPTLNKEAMALYEGTLDGATDAGRFVRALARRKRRLTAVGYLNSYLSYGVDRGDGFYTLHPSKNQTGTDTTRSSSSNPNGENISKKRIGEDGDDDEGGHSVKFAFGPGPGREWYAMDYENIELRLPAYESGEQDLIDLFERYDEPPFYGSEHILNFSIIYPEIWERELAAVGPEKVARHVKEKYKATYYQWCKNGDFAVGYQAGDATADAAFHRSGSRARLKARFAKKDALNDRCVAFANRHGYVETMPDRTVDPKRGYPLYCGRGEYGRISPTIPLNYRVQGTAGWCKRKALRRCYDFLDGLNRGEEFAGRTWAGGHYLVCDVHDELVFDLPRRGRKANKPVVDELRRLMEVSGDDVGVPLKVSVGYHPENWSEDAK